VTDLSPLVRLPGLRSITIPSQARPEKGIEEAIQVLMAATFSRTLRSLEADNSRRSAWGVLVVAALLAAWAGWFFFARVPLYEVTDTARLEVVAEPHPVESPVAGRVVAETVALGRQVQAGEVLVELDSQRERLQFDEERRHLAAVGPQLEALRGQFGAEQQAMERQQQASRVALDEARAKSREAQAATQFAEKHLQALAQLNAQGLVAEIEYLRGKAEAQEQEEAAKSVELEVSRLEREQQTESSDREARVHQLQQQIGQLEGEETSASAAVQRLRHEVERRSVRAPASGRLGEVAALRIGAYVKEGDAIATVVPEGKLRVTASFLPAAALGRIRAGQRARVRLEGFPWTQYGSIPATVSTVASEVRDGRVRVDLGVTAGSASRIPLEHGLPGSVEVQVERIAPASLVLRVAGRLLATPSSLAGSEAQNHSTP
jgi:multidrug resistance efflux pump